MRGHIFRALALSVWLASGEFSRADDQAEAVMILDAAIGAAGGAAKLDKLKTVRLKLDGSMHGGKNSTFSGEGTLHELDHFRFDLDVTLPNETAKIVFVHHGKKGWRKINDRAPDDTPAFAVPLIQSEMHAFRVVQMLTPLKDKNVKLSPLGEIKINERPALGIKIMRKDYFDLDLYFDKETHLAVRCALRAKEPEADQEAAHEWVFSDYKEMGGVKHPTKVVMTRDGKKMVELEIKEVKPEEKVDRATFAKP
jgi:hypothetical protein